MPHMFWECNRLYFDHKLPTPKFGLLHTYRHLGKFEFHYGEKKKPIKQRNMMILMTDVKGGQAEAFKFIDGLKIFSLLANVADVKSLVVHPYTTTHSELTPAELAEAGISPATIRLSIGTEHYEDIINDLAQALDQI